MNFKSGTTGWFLLAALVVGWDYIVGWLLNGETLTAAFRKGMKHPFSRWPVVLAWSITTFHLFGWLKPEFDPYHRLATFFTGDSRARG